MRYTQKQIDKFNRQKYITVLEKVSKNLFKMLRDKRNQSADFRKKFVALKAKMDLCMEVQLDSEYHQQLKSYIQRLYLQTCENEYFTDLILDDIREIEMSHLNRLQKLKNGSSYKKDKHKGSRANEDWG